MSAEIDDGGFVKQRRNLMLISMLLFGALFFGATVEKVGALGIELRSDAPRPLSIYLWPFYIYFIVRYYQASDKAAMRQAYQARLHSKLEVDGVGYFTEACLRAGIPDHIRQLQRFHIVRGKGNVKYEVSMDGNTSDLVKKMWANKPSFMVLEGWEFLKKKLFAGTYVVCKTTHVTDLIFPWIVAAIPLGYWLYLFLAGTTKESVSICCGG